MNAWRIGSKCHWHSDWGKMKSKHCFNLYFLNCWRRYTIFKIVINNIFSLHNSLVTSLGNFKIVYVCFSPVWIFWSFFLNIFWISIFCQIYSWQRFFLILWPPLCSVDILLLCKTLWSHICLFIYSWINKVLFISPVLYLCRVQPVLSCSIFRFHI